MYIRMGKNPSWKIDEITRENNQITKSGSKAVANQIIPITQKTKTTPCDGCLKCYKKLFKHWLLFIWVLEYALIATKLISTSRQSISDEIGKKLLVELFS